MKFVFSSNAFLRHDLLETIRILSSIGYEGIEIMADVPHAFPLHLTDSYIRMIRKAVEDSGLLISNVNAFMHHADGDTYHPSWIEKDRDLRVKRVDYTTSMYRTCGPPRGSKYFHRTRWATGRDESRRRPRDYSGMVFSLSKTKPGKKVSVFS